MKAATVYILLFLAILLLPFVLRATLEETDAPPPTRNARRIIVITPHNQDIRQEFAWAFERWHLERYDQAVTVDYRVPGGAADIKRQVELAYRNRTVAGGFSPDYDVLWGGGDFLFDQELKPLGVFQPLGLPRSLIEQAFPDPTLAGVRLYDTASASPQWVGTALSTFGIAYNPSLYATLGLPPPQMWSDLTDPSLAGLVALADPTHSGSVAIAYAMVLQHAMAQEESQFLQDTPAASQPITRDPQYRAALARGWKRGMSHLLLMAANARYFTASATQVPADVASADAAAGLCIDLYARATAEALGDDRIRYVIPPAATAITPDPVAILAGVDGDRLLLARRFVTFLLTPEAQRLWALKAGVPGGPRFRALRRSPIRQDVYADRSGWSDPTNPYETAGTFNQRAEWLAHFAETRLLWRAAWIDTRTDLKSAYAAVLAIDDPARRADLLARLADLPVELADLDAMRTARRSAPDPEEWKARESIRWSTQFRQHYAAIRAEADR